MAAPWLIVYFISAVACTSSKDDDGGLIVTPWKMIASTQLDEMAKQRDEIAKKHQSSPLMWQDEPLLNQQLEDAKAVAIQEVIEQQKDIPQQHKARVLEQPTKRQQEIPWQDLQASDLGRVQEHTIYQQNQLPLRDSATVKEQSTIKQQEIPQLNLAPVHEHQDGFQSTSPVITNSLLRREPQPATASPKNAQGGANDLKGPTPTSHMAAAVTSPRPAQVNIQEAEASLARTTAAIANSEKVMADTMKAVAIKHKEQLGDARNFARKSRMQAGETLASGDGYITGSKRRLLNPTMYPLVHVKPPTVVGESGMTGAMWNTKQRYEEGMSEGKVSAMYHFPNGTWMWPDPNGMHSSRAACVWTWMADNTLKCVYKVSPRWKWVGKFPMNYMEYQSKDGHRRRDSFRFVYPPVMRRDALVDYLGGADVNDAEPQGAPSIGESENGIDPGGADAHGSPDQLSGELGLEDKGDAKSAPIVNRAPLPDSETPYFNEHTVWSEYEPGDPLYEPGRQWR